MTEEEILRAFPDLEREDIRNALLVNVYQLHSSFMFIGEKGFFSFSK